MSKLVFGVGKNDAGYAVTKYEKRDGKLRQVAVCPFYRTWQGMLERSFGQKEKSKHPTYDNVTCCEEWLTFSNFKRWMETQDWKGKQLDKDIILRGNKLYYPTACAFVLGVTNGFVIACDASRGQWPLGVHWETKSAKFKAQCSNPFTKKREHLGYFNCPQEAHEAWRKRKHVLAQLVAELETDIRVKEALKKRYSVEEWYTSR